MVQLVGILNLTPDSFSDGGQFTDFATAVERAAQLIADGAAIVDIGAESTRPGATPLTAQQEWQRLKPVLTALIQRFPDSLSLDTYHPETAQKALELAPKIIINDVTGLNNPGMRTIVTQTKARCIISHLPGADIQAAHTGALIDDVRIVRDDLRTKAGQLEAAGIARDNIILDPGIGFGKTADLNWELLRFASLMPDYQVMIGYSRKRFLGDRRMELEPNLAAGRVAIDAGAAYLRVHDVAGHQQLLY